MQNGAPFQSVVTYDQRYHPTLAEGHYFPIAESFVHMNGPAPSMPACDSRVAFLLGSVIYLFIYSNLPGEEKWRSVKYAALLQLR